MEDFRNKIQALMDEVYNEWQKEENKGKSKWDVLESFSEAHQIAVAFGNFNYQVENGGLHQWIYNGYFHDDSEKLTQYLESSAGLDERCQKILDIIYKLDQNAQDTNCDRDGYYVDPDDEDSESRFIGDMIDCDGFDAWYYEHCGQDDWWKTVCGVIEKVTGHDFAHVQQEAENESMSSPQLDDTPAQKSLYEPDMFDSQDVAALRERLIDRLADNLGEYFTGLQGMDGKDIASRSSEIAVMTETHYYLTEMHNFHTSELNYLLQFKNPLEVVADAFEADGIGERSTAMWKIFDRQDALQGDYELISDMPEPDLGALVQRLHDRLEENFNVYKRDTLDLSGDEIFKAAADIASVQQSYDYFRNEHAFTAEQAEFLLKLQNPLELLSDRIPLGTENIGDVAEYIFSKGSQEQILNSGSYELVSDDPETPPTTVSTQEKGTKAVGVGAGIGEKPSVIDEIRQSQRDARERPSLPKEKPSHDKAARNKSENDL